MTEADFKKDAEAAFGTKTRVSFIAAEVAKADKYKTRADYEDVKKEYADMAGKAWDEVEQAEKKKADKVFDDKVLVDAKAAVSKGQRLE